MDESLLEAAGFDVGFDDPVFDDDPESLASLGAPRLSFGRSPSPLSLPELFEDALDEELSRPAGVDPGREVAVFTSATCTAR